MSKAARLALTSLPAGKAGVSAWFLHLRSPMYLNEALITADSQSFVSVLQLFLLRVSILSCGTSLMLGFFIVAMYQNLSIQCCEQIANSSSSDIHCNFCNSPLSSLLFLPQNLSWGIYDLICPIGQGLQWALPWSCESEAPLHSLSSFFFIRLTGGFAVTYSSLCVPQDCQSNVCVLS